MNVFVKTYGCTLNQKDGEYIKGVLSKSFKIVDSEEESDIIIVNSCGVKSVTENKILSYIKSQTKPVYLGGCLPKMINTKTLNVKGIFDTNTISKLPEQIKNNIKENLSAIKEDKLKLPSINTKEDIIIIPIAEGCLGDCNYCSVKFARGKLKSYKIEDILKQVKGKKILLTAQDTGCYGKDINTSLIELLNAITGVEGNFKIRVGMMNPEHVIPILNELIGIYKHPKILKFIHIPVQSGSNKILKDMNRRYTIGQFKKIVRELRKQIPEIHISTDIIVGYPTETEEDFKQTEQLLKELKFEIVNLSKFAPRPKTKASLLRQLPSDEIKRRSKILSNIIKN